LASLGCAEITRGCVFRLRLRKNMEKVWQLETYQNKNSNVPRCDLTSPSMWWCQSRKWEHSELWDPSSDAKWL
jgi:hypothetical protein